MNSGPESPSSASAQPPPSAVRPWLRWNWKESLGLLVLSLLFIFLTYRGMDPQKSAFLDLNPHPDCVEYAVVASRIFHGMGADLEINGMNFPSRYPVGFPLALALLHPFFAGSTKAVIVCAPILFIVAALWLFYALLRRCAGPAAAWVGTLLFAANPCVVILGGGLYSESLLALLTVLCAGFFIDAVESGAARSAVLFGVFLGFSMLVRTQVVITIPFFLVARLLLSTRRADFRPILQAFFGAAPFLLALAVIQWWQFGSPFLTGYGYHLDPLKLKLLSPAYFRDDFGLYVSGLFLETPMPGPSIRMPFISLALPVLALAGMICAWRKCGSNAVLLSLLFGGITLLFFSCYVFRDIRFFIQVLLLYFAWAGIGAASIATMLPRRWRCPAIAGILAIALAAPLGTRKTPAAFAKLWREHPQQSGIYLDFVKIHRAILPAQSDVSSGTRPALITAENLVLLDFYTDEFLLYPLSASQEYARVPRIRAAFPDTIDKLLQKRIPVYVTDMGAAPGDDTVALGQIKEDFELTLVPCPMKDGASLYKIIQRKRTVPGRSYWGE